MPEGVISEAPTSQEKNPSPASADPELQRMLENMADGKSPNGLSYSEPQLKRMVKDARRRQLQEMKRAGIENPEELPGEIEGN